MAETWKVFDDNGDLYTTIVGPNAREMAKTIVSSRGLKRAPEKVDPDCAPVETVAGIPADVIDLAAKTWWENMTRRDWSYPTETVKETVRQDIRPVLEALVAAGLITITGVSHG